MNDDNANAGNAANLSIGMSFVVMGLAFIAGKSTRGIGITFLAIGISFTTIGMAAIRQAKPDAANPAPEVEDR